MRPEHWLCTIPLRLRSLFRWGQAARNWTTSCAIISNEQPRNSLQKGWHQRKRGGARG